MRLRVVPEFLPALLTLGLLLLAFQAFLLGLLGGPGGNPQLFFLQGLRNQLVDFFNGLFFFLQFGEMCLCFYKQLPSCIDTV